MRRRFYSVFGGLLWLLVGVCWMIPLSAQGTLSQQVLQMLARTNAWIGQNTFSNLRMANTAIPSDTTYRVYADTSGNLYFNGGLIAGAGGGITPHNLLSSTHPDTLTGSPVRGSVIVGNSTPKWAPLVLGTSGYVLQSNGTDTVFGTDGSALTNLPAANLTGTLAAISGVNLTNLNATNLASGTVALARLSNIANAQIAAAAGITYSKLTLTGGILNADISGSAAIGYSKLALTGSLVTGDLTAATLLFDRWAQNGAAANQVPLWNGAAWVATTLTQAVVTGAGTVTSAALSMPAIFTVGGSPITTAGTFAVTLANETANLVFAGPNTGAAAAPTFRALVNADFPTSGVAAGTYPLVTVNAQGVITAAAASLASGTIVASTPWTFTQTWNNAGVTFNGLLENITDTASNAASLLADLQVAASSKWKVTKAGNVTAAGSQTAAGGYAAFNSTVSSTVAMTAALTAGTQAMVTTQASSEVSGANLFDIAATWNNAANTPTAFKLNITDTASNAASLLLDLLKAGTSQFKVDKSGNVTALGTITGTAGTFTTGAFSGLLSANLGVTVAAGQTAAVTDSDKLTVGGTIIPNTQTFTCYGINVNSLSGDCLFVADRAYQITGIKFVQKTAGGAACAADIEKLTGTQAPAGGTVMGTASYDCNLTVNNTVTTYTLTGTGATLQLAAGNRMGIKLSGTLTALAGLTATITMKAI